MVIVFMASGLIGSKDKGSLFQPGHFLTLLEGANEFLDHSLGFLQPTSIRKTSAQTPAM